MRVQHSYFDGCNGQQMGDHFEGSVEECAAFLVELDTDTSNDRSLNGWTPENAVEALNRCLSEREPLVVDGEGDGHSTLFVTAD
jgi:hypothetical protein